MMPNIPFFCAQTLPRMTSYLYPVSHITLSGGVDLAYCNAGKGDNTLVFVHGLAGYAPVWNAQLNGLSRDFHCLAIDLPGNGKSPSGAYPYSMVFYAECLARFIESECGGETILCGHSMGAQISMMTAIRYPHLVKKLVLIAPAGFEYFHPAEIGIMEHALDLGQIWGLDGSYIDTVIRQSFYQENPASEKIISDLKNLAKEHKMRLWHDMIVASIKSMLREPVEPFLKQIQQKCLIIFGEQDAMIPNRWLHFTETTSGIAYKGAALIEQSELHLIPAAGHFVQMEQAIRVNELILNFAQ